MAGRKPWAETHYREENKCNAKDPEKNRSRDYSRLQTAALGGALAVPPNPPTVSMRLIW